LAVWSGKKMYTCCFRLHIYLRTNNKLIHNSLYVFDSWREGNLSYKLTQHNYSKKMFTWRSRPIRIIVNPDNQLPDKWSSTLLPCQETHLYTQYVQARRHFVILSTFRPGDTLVYSVYPGQATYLYTPYVQARRHIDILNTSRPGDTLKYSIRPVRETHYYTQYIQARWHIGILSISRPGDTFVYSVRPDECYWNICHNSRRPIPLTARPIGSASIGYCYKFMFQGTGKMNSFSPFA
jgi:hypothetical protein